MTYPYCQHFFLKKFIFLKVFKLYKKSGAQMLLILL